MSPVNRDGLHRWVLNRLGELLGVAPATFDPRAPLQRYGLSSPDATRISAELSELLGRSLSPALVWEYPTIEALIAYLTSNSASFPLPRSLEASSPTQSLSPIGQAERSKGGEGRDAQIAIVGMSCRFPMAPDLDAFWRLLIEGVDAITEVPRDRWDVGATSDTDPAAPEKMSARWGGFLDQVDRFDPSFFGISPREATQMDPQQRLLLELTWEALEDASVPPGRLKGSHTGVFVGCLFTDHALLQDRAGREAITAHTSTGGAACILANRISYAFDLQGPSLTVDTASSSSLVAIHLACQSLKAGESHVAVAGGVNLMLVPETTLGMTKLNTMSQDGRCRAFDARGTGYVRSEGAGVLILKRLSDALRAGDRIHAVLRGSAVNNDGASNGLTAPNPVAQEALLRDAARAARIAPSDIHYVEAHGTGTPLGDPIEINALGAVYGPMRTGDRPLLIGSVKTNLGHLEAAAGVAGVIKVALSMSRDALPPSLHFETPNPDIDFAGLHVEVVSRVRGWPVADGKPRCAGVSSFGYGGTNSHVILESPPRSAARLSVIEAGGREALGAAIDGAIAALDRGAPSDTRTLHAVGEGSGERIAVVASTSERLRERLLRAREGGEDRWILRGTQEERPRLVWVFSGPGSRGLDMGRALALEEPVFLEALARCERALSPHLGGSVLDEILDGAPRATLDRLDILWPTLFAFQVALAALLRDLGVEPGAILGHDLGEISAAHVAGALSLDDAARVLAAEVRFAQRSASARIDNTAESGPERALLFGELSEQLRPVRPDRTLIPFISCGVGDRVSGTELDAAYWSRQIQQLALRERGMERAIARLLAEEPSAFLELSPHPLMKPAIEACARAVGQSAPVIAASRRGEVSARAVREAVGMLFVGGVPVTPPAQTHAADARRIYLLPVSGQIDPALREAARRLSDHVERATEVSLDDLCFTASSRHTHHRVRATVAAWSRVDVVKGLRAIADRREHPAVRTGLVPLGERPGLVFVFPGQGSQWVGMGRTLLAENRTFREAIEACDAAILRESGFSVVEEIGADDRCSRLGRIDVVQPMLFAIEVALARLWRVLGVEPDAVIGHSMGEIAAAHVAGALSLDDASAIICRRSRLLGRLAGRGAMALVELTLEEAARALAGYEARLSVAVSNGPRSTVISGDRDALDEVMATLESQGVFCRRVKVDVASHSPQMDVLKEQLAAELAGIRPQPATLSMRSTVTGKLLSGDELDAGYWVKNLRMPVLFGQAVAQSIHAGQTLFLEISPHPLLLHAIEDSLLDLTKGGAAIHSLKREEDEQRCLVDGLAALHVNGRELDWDKLFPRGGQRVGLPLYPWQRERYRLGDGTSARSSDQSSSKSARGRHPLLGTALQLSVPSSMHLWEASLNQRFVPYLTDHRVWQEAVFPAAGYVEMALAAAAEAHGQALAVAEELTFEHPLHLPEKEERRVQVVLTDEESGRARFQVASRRPQEKTWTRHAAGNLRLGVAAPATRVVRERRPHVIQARCKKQINATAFYERMRASGLSYGRSFQSVAQMWLGKSEAIAKVRLPAYLATPVEAYQVHPVLLDACFQVLLGIHLATAAAAGETYVVSGLSALRLFRALGQELWVHAQMQPGDGATIAGELSVIDADGRSQADIQRVQIQRVDAADSAHPWSHFGSLASLSQPLSAIGAEGHEHERTVLSGDISFTELLAKRPLAERSPLLERHILEQLSQVLRLDASRIERLSSFTSLGMDSILRLELRHRLESSLGIRLSTTLLSTYSNPASLAGPLLHKIDLSMTDRGSVPSITPAARGLAPVPGSSSISPVSPAALPAEALASPPQTTITTEAETLSEDGASRAEDRIS